MCRGVVTEINYQFLTAAVGWTNNPQEKIVGARISYGQQDLSFGCVGAACTRAVLTQPLELRAVVSFVTVTEQSQEQYPSPPPFLPRLPSDAFYPFMISAATPLPRSAPMTLFLVLLFLNLL